MRVLYKHLTFQGPECREIVMMSHNSRKRHAKKLAAKYGLKFIGFVTVWVNNKARIEK